MKGSKAWFTSRTLWLAIAGAVVAVGNSFIDLLGKQELTLALFVSAVLQGLLRLNTSVPIEGAPVEDE